MTSPRTAVITGSSSGIGLGIADGLAAAGYNIVLNGIEPAEQIKPARKALEIAHGIKAIYSPANLMKPDGARGLIVADKHGIVGLTKTIALEVAEFGVTVNAICPGYVWAPLVEKQIPDTAKARGMTEELVIRDVLLAAQQTKKFATVEELAALAVFLCSDGAASIMGTALPVDGGWTAH